MAKVKVQKSNNRSSSKLAEDIVSENNRKFISFSVVSGMLTISSKLMKSLKYPSHVDISIENDYIQIKKSKCKSTGLAVRRVNGCNTGTCFSISIFNKVQSAIRISPTELRFFADDDGKMYYEKALNRFAVRAAKKKVKAKVSSKINFFMEIISKNVPKPVTITAKDIDTAIRVAKRQHGNSATVLRYNTRKPYAERELVC